MKANELLFTVVVTVGGYHTMKYALKGARFVAVKATEVIKTMKENKRCSSSTMV